MKEWWMEWYDPNGADIRREEQRRRLADADSKPRCETCRYYVDSGWQTCQRHAPMAAGKGPYNEPEMKVWPRVSYNDWCGDWRAK